MLGNYMVLKIRCMLAPGLVKTVFAAVVVLLAGGTTSFGIRTSTARSIAHEEVMADCHTTAIGGEYGTLEHVQ
jgi:hypothetical protein